MQQSDSGDLEKKDRSGNTPLHLAAQSGHMDVVKTLLGLGAPVNQKNHEGETPLHLAAGAGHKEVVRILLDSGADPTLADNNGAKASHRAAAEGFIEILDLISRKEDQLPKRVNLYYDPVQSSHPYEMHMRRMNIRDSAPSCIEVPEVDSSDRVLTERTTPTKEDNVHLNVNIHVKKTKRGGRKHKKRQNEQENRPVQAIRPDKITDLYLRVMTQFPNEVETKLWDYFFEGRFDEINCSIIDTNRTDRAGLTILHHAVRCCRYMAVERLVTKCKANVNAETFRGVTPVFLAATTGYSDVIRILYENGANINHRIKCGMTPLHYAVVHKNHNSVLTLLYLGANPDAADKNGNTPLHYGAMTTNNLKVVQTLVERGANLQLRNSNNFRPLEVAKKGRDVEIIQYLASVTLNNPE